MPIFEYRCEKCGKTLEALQQNSNSLQVCSEVLDCQEHGKIYRLLSAFSIKGDSKRADSFMEYSPGNGSHSHSSGCGCFGTSSCPSGDVRSKYGLD